MNIKNNKRRQASKEKIKAVFLELLKKRELAKITVSEICELAGINRSTFYANYLDIYDLADKICFELQGEVEGIFKLNPDSKQSKEDFLKLFKHIKENKQIYSVYFKLGYESRNKLPNNLFDVKSTTDNAFIDYRLIFFKSGFNAIVQAWLANSCTESPEQMCQILMHEYRGRQEKIII